MRKLLILGAGGFGQTIYDLAAQLGCYDKIAFLDDRKPNVLGTCGEYLLFADEFTEVYPAFGDNETRMRWIEQLENDGIPMPALIHPKAYVSPTARLAPGTAVLPMAVVNTNARVETGCIVNIGALVDHDCVLETGAHIAPGAIVKAGNRIPEGMKIESGEVIQNGTYPL